VRYHRRKWCAECRISPRKLKAFTDFLAERKEIFVKRDGDFWEIGRRKLLERRDAYTKKNGHKSGQSTSQQIQIHEQVQGQKQLSDTNSRILLEGSGSAGEGGGPIASTIASTIAELLKNPARTRGQFLDAIVALCGEPHWRQWWSSVVMALSESSGGMQELIDLVEWVSKAQDPRTAEQNGLTPYDHPNRVMVKSVTEIMKARGLRWPQFPKPLNGVEK
jgi:hypothetical protein